MRVLTTVTSPARHAPVGWNSRQRRRPSFNSSTSVLGQAEAVRSLIRSRVRARAYVCLQNRVRCARPRLEVPCLEMIASKRTGGAALVLDGRAERIDVGEARRQLGDRIAVDQRLVAPAARARGEKSLPSARKGQGNGTGGGN